MAELHLCFIISTAEINGNSSLPLNPCVFMPFFPYYNSPLPSHRAHWGIHFTASARRRRRVGGGGLISNGGHVREDRQDACAQMEANSVTMLSSGLIVDKHGTWGAPSEMHGGKTCIDIHAWGALLWLDSITSQQHAEVQFVRSWIRS